MSAVRLGAWLSAWLLVSTACAERVEPRESARVFAAASLTASFQALAREFEARHPETHIELHFAGTPQLVLQVREGAEVDVFASADAPNMERASAAVAVVHGPHVFARNRLTIVTAAENPKGVAELADLRREDLVVLLCGPEVPAGRYAREALGKAGVEVRSASDEPSVRAVLNKIRLGEADAGIVYVTDIASAEGGAGAGSSLASVPIPDEHDVVGTYPIAVLGAGRNPELGRRFVDFVRSADGQSLLRSFGFRGPRQDP
jgi:molybdate transport system substrate-binding protein